jgi:hypothetical protein
MLQAITLEGFRCFDDLARLELSALTVFAGANSVGKSSVIQALTALVQSEEQQSRELLRLAGPWVDLGSFRQTLNFGRSGAKRYFRIGLATTSEGMERDVLWTFVEPGDVGGDAARLQHVEAWLGGTQLEVTEEAQSYRWKMRSESEESWTEGGRAEFPHPGLVRLSGREGLAPPLQDFRLTVHNPSTVLYQGPYRSPPPRLLPPRRTFVGPLLGLTGEYAAEMLLSREHTTVDVLPKGGEPLPLVEALNTWWHHIFEGPYALKPERVEGLGSRLLLDTPSAENLSLGQVGTGLAQALPIVVLGLCSTPGQLVIIESPEVHLHPAAQHHLCEFFVALVRQGRQVLIETHSDHLINAIRIAVKRGLENGGLSPDQVALHFFRQQNGRTAVDRLPIGKDGRLERWPTGFFDQSAQALLELMK